MLPPGFELSHSRSAPSLWPAEYLVFPGFAIDTIRHPLSQIAPILQVEFSICPIKTAWIESPAHSHSVNFSFPDAMITDYDPGVNLRIFSLTFLYKKARKILWWNLNRYLDRQIFREIVSTKARSNR